ncbi:hypothetical protein [Shinella kummerowiae]|uniref:hypothetical protein n=1 Tax=Shinella kummerowiae TaxID=417745 RepID=UPI0021B51C17|nr:hypothetical protein [Shinella kummerowiae]MCT7665694.1 hypothetical protein [Shinella kummerowiae]
MNSTDTTTAAPQDAMPSRFDAMTLEDMCNLSDGLHAAFHILLKNEWTANGSTLTGSYLWFKSEAERLNALIQEIADAALNRMPADEDEQYDQEQILVRAKPWRTGRRSYLTHMTVEVRS